MHRTLWALGIVLILTLFAGCLVRTYGPPPGPRRNCRNECAAWGVRDRCDRFCRVWVGGACMAWEQRCRPERTCMRFEMRCY